MNPEAPKLDDARLLPLLRAGNEGAWRELVDALKPRLVALCKRSLAGDVHEAIPDSAPGPAKIHELAEIGERLRFALPKIPILQRAAVELCMSGKTYREIAEIGGVNIGTVKSRIARGRDALRLEMRLAS